VETFSGNQISKSPPRKEALQDGSVEPREYAAANIATPQKTKTYQRG
jgi:hypothetical protein